MKDNMESLESSIMDLKRRKYERDLLDYKRGEVYTWRVNVGERTPRYILRRNYRKRGVSDSSFRSRVNFSSPDKDSSDSVASDQEMDNKSKPNTRSVSKQSNDNNVKVFFRKRRRGGRRHNKNNQKERGEKTLVGNEGKGNVLINSAVVLTPTILSAEQFEVLEKGLHFSPYSGFDLFRTMLDINRFARLLTVKKHFFENVDNTNFDNADVAHKDDRCIVNEYKDLMFADQVSLLTLHDLCDAQTEGVITSDFKMKHTNPSFYPKKARVPALDVFQQCIEK